MLYKILSEFQKGSVKVNGDYYTSESGYVLLYIHTENIKLFKMVNGTKEDISHLLSISDRKTMLFHILNKCAIQDISIYDSRIIESTKRIVKLMKKKNKK